MGSRSTTVYVGRSRRNLSRWVTVGKKSDNGGSNERSWINEEEKFNPFGVGRLE